MSFFIKTPHPLCLLLFQLQKHHQPHLLIWLSILKSTTGQSHNYRGRRRNSRGRGRRGGGRNNNNQNQSWNSHSWNNNGGDTRVRCRLCSGWNHVAANCPQRYGPSMSPAANITMYSYPQQAIPPLPYPLVPDTAATHHVTLDLSNMMHYEPYHWPDQLQVGNGEKLPIKHVGQAHLHTRTRTLNLLNVLHVPNINHPLSSVQKLARDNKVSMKFDDLSCHVKDQVQAKPLLFGRIEAGLSVMWHSPPTPSPQARIVRASPSIWNDRLGHPSQKVSSLFFSK